MALSKKKSRLITIGEGKYRWLVSSNSGYCVFVAEKEGVKGRKMEVYFDRYKSNYGTDLRNNPSNLVIIKPGDAASMILQAQEQGWHPEEKGNPVVFDLSGKVIVKRTNH